MLVSLQSPAYLVSSYFYCRHTLYSHIVTVQLPRNSNELQCYSFEVASNQLSTHCALMFLKIILGIALSKIKSKANNRKDPSHKLLPWCWRGVCAWTLLFLVLLKPTRGITLVQPRSHVSRVTPLRRCICAKGWRGFCSPHGYSAIRRSGSDGMRQDIKT